MGQKDYTVKNTKKEPESQMVPGNQSSSVRVKKKGIANETIERLNYDLKRLVRL